MKRSSIALLSCLLICLGLLPAAGLLWLVRASPANGMTLCVQPGNPACHNTITGALQAAQPGDTIRVAAGLYVEYVTITKTVRLEGGWNGGFTARDPLAYPAVIRPPDDSDSVVSIVGDFDNPAAVAPTLDGLTIVNGGGGNHGGGLRIAYSNAIVSHNIISGNIGYLFGGGIWVQGGAPLLQENSVLANIVRPDVDTAYGGGIQLENSQARLVGNVVARNTVSSAIGYGGGIDIVGGGPVLLQDNTIISNTAAGPDGGPAQTGYGGGVSVRSSTVELHQNRIRGNRANPLGGGLALFDSPYTMTNGLLAANQVLADDSAVGGLYADANSPGLVLNNTIANNQGQGIRTGAAMSLTNNIILGHTTGVSLTDAAPISPTTNAFFNNVTHQRGFTLTAGNLITDPRLNASYHLLATSPLIDAGAFPASIPGLERDFDGEPRPMIGASGLFRFDIGADEATGPAQQTRRLATQPADLTLIGPGNPLDNANSDGSNDWIGNAVLGGDINGDGRADLVVGAQNLSSDFSGGVNDDGRVFALFNTGARRLGVVDLLTTTAHLEVRSWLHQQHIGQAFAAKDLNGDGANDLVIGASGAAAFDVKGAVYIFAGGAGLTGTRTLSPTMQATYRVLASQNTSTFGGAQAVAAAQLDGAGPDDLVIGESLATVNNRDEAGAVYLFFGSSSFPPVWDLAAQPPSLTIYGPAPNAELGKVATGDVNGDGKVDLAVRSLTTLYVFFGPLAPGTIDLAVQDASLTQGGLSDGPLAAGDVTGDGQAELLVGDGQQVKLFGGNGLALLATLTGVNASALHLFDWSGDGKAEMVIGDAAGDRLFVVPGSAGLPAMASIQERAKWIILGAQPGERFGYSLHSGDLDADGGLDLIAGSRMFVLDNRANPDFNDAGAVYVFYGVKPAPSPTPTLTPIPSETPTDIPTGVPTSTPTTSPTPEGTPVPPHAIFLPAVH